MYRRCCKASALFHTPRRTPGRCTADNSGIGKCRVIDIENCPLDGGLPRTRTSGNDANRRCQRSLDGVPLLLSEGEPHLFLLGINLVIQVAHIGQFVPVQHLADLYSHIVLSLCYDRAIDMVAVNRKPIVFEHFKCPLGNSLPRHCRCAE